MTLAVAARSRPTSPATSLGLRLCGVDAGEGEGADDFDDEAPTCPGFDPATLAELDKAATVDRSGELAGSEEVPDADSDQQALAGRDTRRSTPMPTRSP
jgi:hypothetical protein